MEERVLARLGIRQQQRALADVVDDQRRQHQREPGDANRLAAEVAHVGVERFGAGDRRGTPRRACRASRARASTKERDPRSIGLTAASTHGLLDDVRQAERR